METLVFVSGWVCSLILCVLAFVRILDKLDEILEALQK